MEEDFVIAVSPRHSVRLATEYAGSIKKAPFRDFVVRTLVKREANGMPLMSAEIVIAGAETREEFPLAASYPLHFRKSYFPGRLHGDPRHEFECHAAASKLIGVPPPIGAGERVFRACLIPGRSYGSMTPFELMPEERNFRKARELGLDTAVGQWRLAELVFEQLKALQAGGLAHGDAELRNFIVCPSPLEIVPIDFEASVHREALDDEAWAKRCRADMEPLLRHAALLLCSLGAQPGELAREALAQLDVLFKVPDRVRREIDHSSEVEGG
jgi:hypothetical protein